MTNRISVARDFNPHPGPRYRHQGSASGEEFRDRHLLPAIRRAGTGGKITVDLDGAEYGYPVGWLEEVFGGLVRALGPDAAERIEIAGGDERTRDDIKTFMHDAATFLKVENR